jgi:intracellular septation protein
MKVLFDLFPVALFVGTYMLTDDIYLATAVIIPATIAQVAYAHFRYGKVDKMLWASLVLIVIMGGLTLLLQDQRFIMWKPTLLYWLFAAVLLAAPVFMKTNLIKTVLGKEINAPEIVWWRLNIAWALFFASLGFLNLYVAYNFPLATWVQFKLWGGLGLMIAFVIAQAFYLARYMEQPSEQEKQ